MIFLRVEYETSCFKQAGLMAVLSGMKEHSQSPNPTHQKRPPLVAKSLLLLFLLDCLTQKGECGVSNTRQLRASILSDVEKEPTVSPSETQFKPVLGVATGVGVAVADVPEAPLSLVSPLVLAPLSSDTCGDASVA